MFINGWNLPKNKEVGSSICRTKAGKLVPGKMASGSMTHVDVELTCPPNTQFEGVWHTHPMGLAQPSEQDYEQARKLGVKKLCVTSTGHGVPDETRCYSIR
jgi:proteasome lid subunit RPN8/RPN11